MLVFHSQVLFPVPQHKYKDHVHSPVQRQEGAKERAGITGQARPTPNFPTDHQHSWQHRPPHEPIAFTHWHHQVRVGVFAQNSRVCVVYSDNVVCIFCKWSGRLVSVPVVNSELQMFFKKKKSISQCGKLLSVKSTGGGTLQLQDRSCSGRWPNRRQLPIRKRQRSLRWRQPKGESGAVRSRELGSENVDEYR